MISKRNNQYRRYMYHLHFSPLLQTVPRSVKWPIFCRKDQRCVGCPIPTYCFRWQLSPSFRAHRKLPIHWQRKETSNCKTRTERILFSFLDFLSSITSPGKYRDFWIEDLLRPRVFLRFYSHSSIMGKHGRGAGTIQRWPGKEYA